MNNCRNMAAQGGRKPPSLLAPPPQKRGHDVKLLSLHNSYGWSFGEETFCIECLPLVNTYNELCLADMNY